MATMYLLVPTLCVGMPPVTLRLIPPPDLKQPPMNGRGPWERPTNYRLPIGGVGLINCNC